MKARRIISYLFLAIGVAAVVGLTALPGRSSEAAERLLELRLSGAQEVPPVDGAGTAFARLTFDDTTNVLTYALTVSGISGGQVTAAHIHRGAAGENGPVVYTLGEGPFTQVEGSITLTAADVADLKAGLFYINVHSTTNPGGFARGQINLDPAQAIVSAVEAAIAAWNAMDVEGLLARLTDSFLQEEFDLPDAATAREVLPEFIGSDPITDVSVESIVVTGASATAVVTLEFGEGFAEVSIWHFELIGGIWKASGSERFNQPIPSGVTAVDIDLQEYAFVYDEDEVASGNFAFRASNIGDEEHEIVLVKIETDKSLREILESTPEDEEPEGVEFIVFDMFSPGESGNVLLPGGPLAAGRYGLVCFLPSPDGVPHAFLGMTSEFTVSGGAVSPPNTGDGGLIRSETSSSHELLAAGALLSFVAAGAIGISAHRLRRVA